jgi:protein-disulfide isomerase
MSDKKYLYIGVSAFVLGLFFMGAKFHKSQKQETLNEVAKKEEQIFVRDYSPRMGDPQAKVTLVEFFDPECESCRAVYPGVKEILKEYEGKVQLVLRYAPFHGNSKEVIKALEAVKNQDKYWQALEILFATQPQWGSHHNPRVELIYEILPKIGVDIEKLKEDMKNSALDGLLEQELSDLQRLGVKGTPTFYVNGQLPEGYSYQALRKLLEQEVAKAYP